LVRYFHQRDDWRTLLDLYSQDIHDESVLFGFHRLMFELHILTRADDCEAMVFEAINSRVPGVALQVLEGVGSQEVFSGPDSGPGRYERLLTLVQKEVAINRSTLPRLAAKAAPAHGGLDDLLAGETYLSYGQSDQAIDALNRGINEGGLVDADAAQISLGIAYWKLDLRDLADEAFRAVAKRSQWAELAELWRLRIDNNTLVN
jgi:tetratricopeptide (TPR) repeat protein